jgi:enoyl-CoA hydratase/carnithine racemase
VLSAAEAEAGLVNRIVPDDEVDTATAALAQQLADGATLATDSPSGSCTRATSSAGRRRRARARTITQVMGGHDAHEDRRLRRERAAAFRGE